MSLSECLGCLDYAYCTRMLCISRCRVLSYFVSGNRFSRIGNNRPGGMRNSG